MLEVLRIDKRYAAAVGMIAALLLAAASAVLAYGGEERAKVATRFVGPTSSQPLALSADDSRLIVANPDNDTVTVFHTVGGQLVRLAEVAVGDEPNGVAILPDGSKGFVANTVSGTITVLRITPNQVPPVRSLGTIKVGTEPYGLALTPNGTRLYVTNARSNTVSVIDTGCGGPSCVVATVKGVGFEPRGIAITNDGDGVDSDETVYVTQFLAAPVPGKLDGEDDAKVGKVRVIGAASNRVVDVITLEPLADTGFKALGDSLARIAPLAAEAANFKFKTGAYPNQLNSIAIKGGFAYVPNTGASPNGPVRFDVNTQSLLSVIDRSNHTDAGQTLNMHRAVAEQTGTPKLFLTVPWSIAFEHQANVGYVVSAASNVVVKLGINAVSGAAEVAVDPSDPSRVLQLKVGKNPRGIVVTSDDRRAFVLNYVSRDVSVLDLTTSPERVIGTLRSAALPKPGSLADLVHVGRELYNTSVGEFDPAPGTTTPIVGRMSNNGWGACSGCHPNGLSDNVVWIFGGGPRRTISQHTDFDLGDPSRKIQRVLNWSAERDEEEDFELNIRGVSGGQGLLVLADGVTQDPEVANFTPRASGGRNQLKVRGHKAWDAIEAFIQRGIRPPISPLSATNADVQAGRQLFIRAKCQACHGGRLWTSSKVAFTPPPGAALILDGQVRDQLRAVGTFDASVFNEVRANAAAPLGKDGFVPPSLLSLHAFPETFLHNGSAVSLNEVLRNVAHRSAGTGGVDKLSDAEDRRQLITFLRSIDAGTKPIAP